MRLVETGVEGSSRSVDVLVIDPSGDLDDIAALGLTLMDCVIAFYEKPCCPPFGKLCGVGHSKGSDPIYA